MQINFRKTPETRGHRQQPARHRRAGRRLSVRERLSRSDAPAAPPAPHSPSIAARPGAAALPAAERSGAAPGPGSTAPSRSAPRHRPRAATAALGLCWGWGLSAAKNPFSRR